MKKAHPHILFWIVLYTLRTISTLNFGPLINILVASAVFCVCEATVVYSTNYLLQKIAVKKIIIQIIKILLILISASFLFQGAEYFLAIIKLPPYMQRPPCPYRISLMRSFVAVSAGFFYRYFSNNIETEHKQEQLMLEKAQIELQYLKSQINPHFLFNTLNNLYGLTYNKSERAPEVVLMLSNTMRYIIYETKSFLVPLDSEINFIDNYIQLEKLRFSENKSIVFNTDIPKNEYKIAPLLLLPFIENCFKHSDIQISDAAKIEINIWIESQKLIFSCSNTYHKVEGKKEIGIGLENVKKRLEIMYKSEYKLEMSKENNTFYVLLICPLYNKTQSL